MSLQFLPTPPEERVVEEVEDCKEPTFSEVVSPCSWGFALCGGVNVDSAYPVLILAGREPSSS